MVHQIQYCIYCYVNRDLNALCCCQRYWSVVGLYCLPPLNVSTDSPLHHVRTNMMSVIVGFFMSN